MDWNGLITGAAIGVPAHLIVAGLTGGPVASVARIVASIAMGALVGALVGFRERTSPRAGARPEIVVLGGGFAGLYTCLHLEDVDANVTLVSDRNAVLFTPMLAEVAGSSLEPSHIATPLRSSLDRTRVVRGTVSGIDLEARQVTVGDERLGFDHLVIALGAVNRSPKTSEPALALKTLEDAMRVRNQVIERFEEADRETDEEKRRALLTFVVAGGGFAGVELAGAVNDFARGMLVDYPRLDGVRVVLVHSRDRILPELSEELARYAQRRMEERGVEFLLGRRLADCTATEVRLEPDEVIPARTLVFTAGTGPNPLPKEAGLPVDARGAVVVDGCLAVKGVPDVWALGDVAAVFDGVTGKACPPTAQFALREARAVARNIALKLEGSEPRPFHFAGLGSMCVVGHQVACAELAVPLVGTVRFGGLLAWLMWRGVYLSKLPGLERKVRVLADWVIELFFPRDVVQTMEVRK